MRKMTIVKGAENPILRSVARKVTQFDENLKKLVKGMSLTMYLADGLGIAAPQVGVSLRVFIVILNLKEKNEREMVMVNPEILDHSEETDVAEEGCLSLPGQYGRVERWKETVVSFANLKGENQILRLTGLNARVFQHELDHLNGVLFIDKLS